MVRNKEEMAARDAKCLEIEAAFRRAGVPSSRHRMPAMPLSSVVAWSSYGPSHQRRVLVTVDDNGDCRVLISAVCAVPEGRSGEDWLCSVPMTLLCSLPASTPRLGDEMLSRLHEADDEAGPWPSRSDPAQASPAIRSAVEATAAWALGHPFANDHFADDGDCLFPNDDDNAESLLLDATVKTATGT